MIIQIINNNSINNKDFKYTNTNNNNFIITNDDNIEYKINYDKEV